MAELKKCPFCGGEAHIVKLGENYLSFYVECKKCCAESSAFSAKGHAIEAWNRRAE